MRLYAAVTGRCVAGNRRTSYEDQQRRVKNDFAAGVRLVLDRTNEEIRAFVPVVRESTEAFIAAGSLENKDSITSFINKVYELVNDRDGWTIQSDSQEKILLDNLRDSRPDQIPKTVTQQIKNEDVPLVIEVPSVISAVAAIEYFILPEGRAIPTIVVGNPDNITHIDWDICVCISTNSENISVHPTQYSH